MTVMLPSKRTPSAIEKASEHIMSIVSAGYRLPFARLPTTSFLENHSMSYVVQQKLSRRQLLR